MKVQPNKRPKNTSIDISKEPYDHLLQNLKYWKIKDNQTIISTLNSLLQYKYSGITELQMIANHVSLFHKEICQVNQKQINDSQKLQVHPLIFQKIIELKNKFKKLEKNGCFKNQKVIKSKIQDQKTKKKNLVNIEVPVPQILFIQQKQTYHQNLLSKIYRSFVAYYPESHSQQNLNQRLITFLEELYKLMKSRFFYLKQKEYFDLEIQRLCTKLKKQKFLQNKKKMLSGQIKVKDVVYNKLIAFENLTAKRKDQEEMRKILKQSEMRFEADELKNPQKQRDQFEGYELQGNPENENHIEHQEDNQ